MCILHSIYLLPVIEADDRCFIEVSLSKNSFWMLLYFCVRKMRYFNHFDSYMHYYSLSFITAVILHLVCAGLKEK